MKLDRKRNAAGAAGAGATRAGVVKGGAGEAEAVGEIAEIAATGETAETAGKWPFEWASGASLLAGLLSLATREHNFARQQAVRSVTSGRHCSNGSVL